MDSDKKRISELRDVEQYRDGSMIVFCWKCPFQYEPDTVGPTRCPDCRAPGLGYVVANKELRDFVAVK